MVFSALNKDGSFSSSWLLLVSENFDLKGFLLKLGCGLLSCVVVSVSNFPTWRNFPLSRDGGIFRSCVQYRWFSIDGIPWYKTGNENTPLQWHQSPPYFGSHLTSISATTFLDTAREVRTYPDVYMRFRNSKKSIWDAIPCRISLMQHVFCFRLTSPSLEALWAAGFLCSCVCLV